MYILLVVNNMEIFSAGVVTVALRVIGVGSVPSSRMWRLISSVLAVEEEGTLHLIARLICVWEGGWGGECAGGREREGRGGERRGEGRREGRGGEGERGRERRGEGRGREKVQGGLLTREITSLLLWQHSYWWCWSTFIEIHVQLCSFIRSVNPAMMSTVDRAKMDSEVCVCVCVCVRVCVCSHVNVHIHV